jgi:4-hydroxy-3-polyprenylbenzoate decarboxylase
MAYSSLEACLLDLEQNGQLIRIKEEVDPYLEMASIHLRIHEQKGPAILFEKVKGSKFRAVSNIFGTLERSEFIFRKTLPCQLPPVGSSTAGPCTTGPTRLIIW